MHSNIFLLVLCATAAFGRIHRLNLVDDSRKQITLSTFGFLKKGTLTVNITGFSFHSGKPLPVNKTSFGFTLDKSQNSGASSYLETTQEKCIFDSAMASKKEQDKSVDVIRFMMDTNGHKMVAKKEPGKMDDVFLSDQPRDEFLKANFLARRDTAEARKKFGDKLGDKLSDKYLLSRKNREADPDPAPTPKTSTVAPVTSTQNASTTSAAAKEGDVAGKPSDPFFFELKEKSGVFSTYFLAFIATEEQEGLYNLYFHNCLNYDKDADSDISLSVEIVEDNNGNFLSAGEMPLPYLFFVASVVYFVLCIVWLTVLRRSKEAVYKIHWLMFAVVLMKCLTNLFHGVNHHFIQARGYHEEAWAVLYYIVYLAKGALMFICILLIGAGWAFVKHMLSDKEKKLFLIFIPLQVLDQVAWVIVEESEEGQSSYFTWKEIFILVDLLCCGAILFPVVWSIRHLQEASKTDGKAALNLNKLKLFRQFYILVVCYIYFTRIIVYLMKITLPFRLVWLTEMFLEIAVVTFFMVTGFKFRPASDNPYLQVPLDSDDEIEMEEVLTRTGNMDSLTKVNQHHKSESQEPLIKQRESSHEYD